MNEVKIWEEPIIIPTYEVGQPDKNPMFLEKRVYQGSSGKIYPYPSTQEISREKTDKVWKAVWLENEYIKVMVLPELGGRIQRAYDKTNDYDFIYYNHVIKPALVGLTGPWISGGIEFNWPQHHRPTTYLPVDYKIVEHADGSKSLLTGDVDQMYGTKEVTSITLYPGKAYIEIRGQLYNRTPLPQTFLWWANPAVAVNDYTQSIFPPDVHSVYDHGKRAVSRFPIATGEYYKHDYSEGVDISRYKNIPVPTSYMAEKSEYDFVGGYDYQKKAGLLHVADHHISPGKKQWTWGCGDFGKAWDRNLTDEDGPYIELMTGMYCDNQPDFTWLKPYEEKVFKQYFMPYKAVGQVKNASIHAMLNVEVRDEGLYICAYATEFYQYAKIVVSYGHAEIGINEQSCSHAEIDSKEQSRLHAEIDSKEQSRPHAGINVKEPNGSYTEIYTQETSLSPIEIYEKVLPIEIPDPYKVRVSIKSGDEELVSYQPKDPGIPELAKPAKAAKDPQNIMTNEELFLTGQHIEQYRHATYLPDSYYLEGLKRDKEDIRINNAYGLLLLRRGCFAKAEGHFRQALVRLTRMNPNPYDSEPYYNLGLSLFYQENYDEAYETFYKATWTNEQQEMAFYFLASIEARRHSWYEALEFIEKSLVKNAHNIKARGLKAILLLKLGRIKEADAWMDENQQVDAFDFVSLFLKCLVSGIHRIKPVEGELWDLAGQRKPVGGELRDFAGHRRDGFENQLGQSKNYEIMKDFHALSRDFHETYLQTARDFAESGFYEEAVAVLDAYPGEWPMVHYYRGFYLSKLARDEEAIECFMKGESCSPMCCFPNKLEDIQVLSGAIRLNPEGAKAYYYLGCLYYDKLQYEDSIRLWEKSEKLDDTYPTLIRNLAIAYYNKKKEPEKALHCLEKAFDLDRTDARVFLELDQLYQKLQFLPERRLEKYTQNIGLIEKRDDLYTEYVTLLNLLGKHKEAYEKIIGHDFQTWEGAEGKITTQFKTALLEMAKEDYASGDYTRAKDRILEALSYPKNLGEGRLEGTKDNHLYYHLGLTYEKLGKTYEAQVYFQKATPGAADPSGIMYYYDQPADMILYQGLAFKKLGDTKAANARFYKLMDYGEKHVRDDFKMDYFAVSRPDMSVFDADMTEKNRAHCHYLMGLGKLGLGRNEGAVRDFDAVLQIDRNHQNAAIYRKMARTQFIHII